MYAIPETKQEQKEVKQEMTPIVSIPFYDVLKGLDMLPPKKPNNQNQKITIFSPHV